MKTSSELLVRMQMALRRSVAAPSPLRQTLQLERLQPATIPQHRQLFSFLDFWSIQAIQHAVLLFLYFDVVWNDLTYFRTCRCLEK